MNYPVIVGYEATGCVATAAAAAYERAAAAW